MAFDPTLSPHYKVLQFSTHPYSRCLTYVDFFSSKERGWINSEVFWLAFSQYRLLERPSVFFNGALHFVSRPNSLVSFDVEELTVRTIRLPRSPDTLDVDELHYDYPGTFRRTEGKRYFKDKFIGRCQGHLYYIYSAEDHSESEIWMLQNYETGEWLLKYTIHTENIKNHPVAAGFTPHYLRFHPDTGYFYEGSR